MIEIPLKWQELLKDLKKHDPNAVLAGGAIRDLICNKRPRDLDFWVGKWHWDLHDAIAKWGTVASVGCGNGSEYHAGNIENIVYEVWLIKPYKWLPRSWQTTINVIWCDLPSDPMKLVEKFDFGICMVAYDGEKIIRSRHFDHDLENKVFTLRRAVYPIRIVKSQARYNEKFKRKYGWPMELSGQARLDQMLRAMHAKMKPPHEEEGDYYL